MERRGNLNGQKPLEEVFDWLAPQYDGGFTNLPIGKRQRHVVHRRLFPLLRPESRVLELNCGTGQDAVQIAERSAEVVATDISPEMIRITASKAALSPTGNRIKTRRMAMEELRSAEVRDELGRFDLIFSDFDGLNCVPDISWLPEAAAALLKPGGQIVMVYMNFAWLPILLGLGKLMPGLPLQLEREGIVWNFGDGHSVPTYFHRISHVRALFSGRFEIVRIEGVRLVSPLPTSLIPLYERHPAVFDRLDDFLSTLPPFNRLGQRVLFHLRLKQG
jgi:2-polyprenyl-3-methyl-5-hydroxy-6-metoxy-1,4-benzoquinol methylase